MAQKIAMDQSPRDLELGKRLWIMCCKDALSDTELPSKKAIEVLRASNGIISVEDLLLFLPETVKVDELRDEVCASLERYNSDIEKLKNEMDEHSKSAEALRRDAAEEKRRFDVIKTSKRCDDCGKKIFSSDSTLEVGVDEFYIFPCTHIFHSTCLFDLVVSHFSPDKRDKVLQLAKSNLEKDQVLLEEIIGATCPFCGKWVISTVALPLVFAQDDQEARSWEY